MTLKTPWTLIDPTDDGAGILARIVTDREMGHVAVFESPETARATVETMNRAESAEQERRELERELAETREKLQQARKQLVADQLSSVTTRAERAVLDAMARPSVSALRMVCDAFPGSIGEPIQAEFARRGEKPFAGVRASDWLRELREEDEEKT